MPDEKGNLYVFEAMELRNEYDRHIKLLEQLVLSDQSKRDRLFAAREEEEREPATGFDPKQVEEQLKKLQTKRVKLNQAIQVANFEAQIDYRGEQISLAEALEIRKRLRADLDALSQRVQNSAYKRIIHKEERDIVREPTHAFQQSYPEFQDKLRTFRQLITQLHRANHRNTVKFKDEA
jgi:hypothetical protein